MYIRCIYGVYKVDEGVYKVYIWYIGRMWVYIRCI